MDSVIRAAVVYVVLLLLLRVAGRRTLSDMTNFDLVLILVIGDATQQALLGQDYSLTNAFLVIITLLALNVALSLFKRDFAPADRILEGLPTIVVLNGTALQDRLRWARISEQDVLQSARERLGIVTMQQIRIAVLEVDGRISIVEEKLGNPPPAGPAEA